jgi:hypothetical protein
MPLESYVGGREGCGLELDQAARTFFIRETWLVFGEGGLILHVAIFFAAASLVTAGCCTAGWTWAAP